MKTLLLVLFAVSALFVEEANAQRRFLFPNLVAARANAQANANIAVANANASIAVAQASRNGVFLAPQVAVVRHHNAVVFNSPVVVAAAPVNRSNTVFFGAPVVQAPVVYQQPQVFQALPALAVPSYAPAAFSAVQYSASGYCGF